MPTWPLTSWMKTRSPGRACDFGTLRVGVLLAARAVRQGLAEAGVDVAGVAAAVEGARAGGAVAVGLAPVARGLGEDLPAAVGHVDHDAAAGGRRTHRGAAVVGADRGVRTGRDGAATEAVAVGRRPGDRAPAVALADLQVDDGVLDVGPAVEQAGADRDVARGAAPLGALTRTVGWLGGLRLGGRGRGGRPGQGGGDGDGGRRSGTGGRDVLRACGADLSPACEVSCRARTEVRPARASRASPRGPESVEEWVPRSRPGSAPR